MNRGRPKRGKMSPSACGEDSTAAPHIFYLPLICCGASRYSTTLQRLLRRLRKTVPGEYAPSTQATETSLLHRPDRGS